MYCKYSCESFKLKLHFSSIFITFFSFIVFPWDFIAEKARGFCLNVLVPWLHDVDDWFEDRRGDGNNADEAGDNADGEDNGGDGEDNGGQEVVVAGEPVDNRDDNRTSQSIFQVKF